MPATIQSKRYAQAIFEIAQEKNELKEWQPSLRKIAELTRDSEFMLLVENPRLPFEVKTKLLQEKVGKITSLALNLAYLLIAKDSLKSAEQIAYEYERLLNDYYGIGHAEITTAIPIDDTDKERLVDQIEAMVGKKVTIDIQVDANILGGIIARVDDMLIDGSIRNKLEVLKDSLVKASR